jgi:hypothetical protein
MANHNAAFVSGVGHIKNTTRANDSSLNAQARMWNDEDDATLGKPFSVLQPLAPSANGMSAQDATNRTFNGVYLGSGDGESMQGYQQVAEMQMEDQT